MYLTVVVPCYNEEGNLHPLHERLMEELKEYASDMEIVFVNDGSRDGTKRELSEVASLSPVPVRVIDFSRNFGKEAALLAGLSHSRGEKVAIIDADLQQNPKYVAQMLAFLRENPDYDCVAAYQDVRREGKVLSFFKKTFYRLINRLTSIEFYRSASDFRVLDRKMVDAILSLPERCRFSKGIFSWVGFRTHYMPYHVEARHAGKTKWSFWRLASYAVNGIVAFSDKPLILSSVLGLLLFFIAIVMMLFVVIKTLLFGDPVAGFPTLASLILSLSGIQLLCLGIVGQYLAKMYEEVKGRPVYLVKEILDNREDPKQK
ncbi:MAG: glycosyltransferase family 2 protein [Clostridia bacterium]|nr:glycosyltransferase family 2 protein [Clostridia bacterium]